MEEPGHNRRRFPRLLVLILGITAFSFGLACIIFTVFESAAWRHANSTVCGLAAAAAACNFVSLGLLVTVLVHSTRRQDNARRPLHLNRALLPVASTTIAVVATLLTLAAFLLEKKYSHTLRRSANLLPAKFFVWGIFFLAQLGFFYIAVSMGLSAARTESAVPSGTSHGLPIPKERDPTPPMSLRVLAPNHAQDPTMPSPTFSNASTPSLQSWRSSIQHVVRPVTSKTRLLNKRRDSKSLYAESIDNVSQSDGFDSWDTSSVGPQVRDAVMHSAPGRGTVLEPIPGSRSASPARALDGPFPAPTPARPSTAISEEPLYTSRPTSPAVSEAHIHPLFRSGSPVPPPMATPGTVVTASPMSGQVIPRPFSRMRSESSLATVHSPLGGSYFDEHHSRSPSPQSRTMTPPIPDSIFSGSRPTTSAEHERH